MREEREDDVAEEERPTIHVQNSIPKVEKAQDQKMVVEKKMSERRRSENLGKEGEEEIKMNRKSSAKEISELVKQKEENQQIFQAAYGERKTMNITQMREYMEKRRLSFDERSKICKLIRNMFYEKQKNTKNFLKTVIKYFEDYIELYQFLNKSIGKLELKKKYTNHVMVAAIKESVLELIQLNDIESEHVQNFIDWLEKILIQAFKSSENYFKERIKKLYKDIDRVEHEYYLSETREHRAYEKLSEGNDLLQKQLHLMEKIKITNQAAINRAVNLYEVWEYLLEEERTIKRLLSENILQFHEKFIRFYKRTQKKGDGARVIYEYWSHLPQTPSTITVFASFLGQKEVEYINFGSRFKTVGENFENFMRMTYEEKRIGNPHPYLQILISKKFKTKIQMSQREWREVKLIFTVDRNALIFDEREGKCLLKLKESSIKIKRISENILQLSGLQHGIIFDSSKKQPIHFQSLDEIEEFVYFVNSISNTKPMEQ